MAQDPLRSGTLGIVQGVTVVDDYDEVYRMYALNAILTQLRQLPYEDMRQLARMIDNELLTEQRHKDNAVALADVISRVAATVQLDEKATGQTEETLRRAIRRVTNIQIKPEKKGWSVRTKDATITCSDLKKGVHELLDQVAVVHILRET